jgi:hypothetical protein
MIMRRSFVRLDSISTTGNVASPVAVRAALRAAEQGARRRIGDGRANAHSLLENGLHFLYVLRLR